MRAESKWYADHQLLIPGITTLRRRPRSRNDAICAFGEYVYCTRIVLRRRVRVPNGKETVGPHGAGDLYSYGSRVHRLGPTAIFTINTVRYRGRTRIRSYNTYEYKSNTRTRFAAGRARVA